MVGKGKKKYIVFWIPEEGKDPGDVAIMLQHYAQPRLEKLIANISQPAAPSLPQEIDSLHAAADFFINTAALQ
jgi:hypothetical protein